MLPQEHILCRSESRRLVEGQTNRIEVSHLTLVPGNRFDDRDLLLPIFEANGAAVAATLIRKGADPNARDRKGQTALFDPYYAESKSVLIAAGADVNARDKFGATALFYQSNPESIKVLLAAGADVNAVDLKGRTAIESTYSEDCITTLLAAGARLPTDPERLNALIAKAAKNGWTELLRRFEAAAAGK